MGRLHGFRGEDNFRAELNKRGIQYEFVNEWYDFEVLNQKIEIKSCNFSINNGYKGKDVYKIGRFDFTDKENRQQQYDNNIWVCFILRWRQEYIILGFCRAKKLNKQRYISLHQIRDLNLATLDDWIETHNK